MRQPNQVAELSINVTQEEMDRFRTELGQAGGFCLGYIKVDWSKEDRICSFHRVELKSIDQTKANAGTKT
jgi:hypothetical protein